MDNEGRLWTIAEQQEGFFTTRQALEAGYFDPNFSRMITSGKWIRENHGVYRLVRYPFPERPELIQWSLWSRNKAGTVQGVWSHETALELRDVSDVNPVKMHLTVPQGFRKKPPGFILLHYHNLGDPEIEERKGYFVTTPLRTLVDVFREGKLSHDLLVQSVREMVNNGLVLQMELQRARKFYPEIEEMLEVQSLSAR